MNFFMNVLACALVSIGLGVLAIGGSILAGICWWVAATVAGELDAMAWADFNAAMGTAYLGLCAGAFVIMWYRAWRLGNLAPEEDPGDKLKELKTTFGCDEEDAQAEAGEDLHSQYHDNPTGVI